MVTLAHVFSRLHKKRVLVAGDFMLDRYTYGKSKRISPEAPVPIIHVDKEEDRAGGAGNVVLNLLSLGMDVVAVGRVGNDKAGKALRDSLQNEGADISGIIIQDGLQTPQKTRIIASNQQIVRIDHEKVDPLSADCEQQVLRTIYNLVSSVDVVAISDYAKGFLTDNVLKALIQAAKELGVPLIADPKGSDFKKYQYASILKPNLQEALTAAKLPASDLKAVAKAIFAESKVDVLLITRSEAGISLFYPDGRQEDYPVQAREVRDVTGAGDTVLAVITCALANKLPLPEAVALSNIAGTIAVECVGCARVTLTEIARRLLDFHAGTKIFTAEHSSALKQALLGQNFHLFEIQSEFELNLSLLKNLREHAQKCSSTVVISIMPPYPDEETIGILASLKEVDYIFLKSSAQEPFISGLTPVDTVQLAPVFIV